MTDMNGQAGESGGQQPEPEKSPGFSRFLTARVVAGIVLGLFVLWGVWTILGFFDGDKQKPVADGDIATLPSGDHTRDKGDFDFGHEAPWAEHDIAVVHESPDEQGLPSAGKPSVKPETWSSDAVSSGRGAPDRPADSGQETTSGLKSSHDRRLASEEVASSDEAVLHGPDEGKTPEPKAVGVRLVEATVSALDYELNERFWGWRRNDLIRFTDNVENMQLGILEVVRRTSVILMERMSRHGVSASIDKNLENAMNWLMIKPDEYWFPSAEEKYKASLKELRRYAEKLQRGEARFYVRSDTLIPLLLAFADLVGSCDENLVKTMEDDGSPVSWFRSDDYFYYSKGVAKAMGKILHAVREDFSGVLEARQSVDLINHAIHACHEAAELDPWIVTNASLDGILANHRANIAAHISHVRYFLTALAKTLST
jgi:hypothetical protein